MTTIKGTGDGGLTQQSGGWKGQRMLSFLVVIVAANFTLWFGNYIDAPDELVRDVIVWVCLVGIVLVLGRSGVHIAEAWAQSKLGKMESRTVVESTVSQTPQKKK